MNRMRWTALAALVLIAPITTTLRAQQNDPGHADHDHLSGERPGCGTFLYWQLLAEEEKLDEKGKDLLRELKTQARPNMQRNIVSRDGHFRIHYDVTGSNAPDLIDQNNNGIPDYIDSVDYYMEFAWQKEIEECGYAVPPPDNVAPGVGGIDERIDVFITELSRNYYGLAQPEADISGNRQVGYLVLDNDYRGYPTPGIAGLRVTTAHEFHHIVQFSAYLADYSQAALYEATSTWMEYKVHPDLNDYRFYFNNFLLAPQQYPFSTHNVGDNYTGYAHMHYLLSIAQQLDNDIVLEIWNEFKRTGRSFDAIDAALKARNAGLNLTNSYCTFARWSYYTGANAADTSFFAKASQYPTIKPVEIKILDEGVEKVIPGNLSPLAFGLWRILIPREERFDPDTVDFLITNGRSDLGKGGFAVAAAEEFTLYVSQTPQADYTPILYRNGTLYYKLEAPHQDFCVETLFNGSPGIFVTANPSPQPFINDGADQMVFAVSLNGIEITNVALDIYSTAMTKVAEVRRPGLETLNNVQGVIWDGKIAGGDLAPSGVYIYTLAINGSEPSVGKFAVVRK